MLVRVCYTACRRCVVRRFVKGYTTRDTQRDELHSNPFSFPSQIYWQWCQMSTVVYNAQQKRNNAHSPCNAKFVNRRPILIWYKLKLIIAGSVWCYFLSAFQLSAWPVHHCDRVLSSLTVHSSWQKQHENKLRNTPHDSYRNTINIDS